MGRIPEKTLNLPAHFFGYGWSASVMWDRRGRRDAPTVGEPRWPDIKGPKASGGKWPAAHSGLVCRPQQPRPAKITAALSQICLTLSQRTNTHTLTFPAIPDSQSRSDYGTCWTGRGVGGGGGSWEWVWTPNRMTLWPLLHQCGHVL